MGPKGSSGMMASFAGHTPGFSRRCEPLVTFKQRRQKVSPAFQIPFSDTEWRKAIRDRGTRMKPCQKPRQALEGPPLGRSSSREEDTLPANRLPGEGSAPGGREAHLRQAGRTAPTWPVPGPPGRSPPAGYAAVFGV